MPLMLFVGSTEHVVEFSDQVTYFERCLDRPFNRDIHGVSAKVNVIGSLGVGLTAALHLSREGVVL